MNETLHYSDQTPLFSELVYERLLPQKTPEMGFQSYEKLAGSTEYRAAEQKAFIAGDIRNPTLDYPYIDTDALELMKVKLEVLISQGEHLDDPLASRAVQSSAAYRINEMTWLQKAKVMNDLAEKNPC